MRNILLWFILVVICVHVKIDSVYGKSSKLVNKHGNEVRNKSKKVLNIENNTKKSDSSLPLEKDSKFEERNHYGLSILTENANSRKQISSKIVNEGRISTEDYLKSLTSTQPKEVSKHEESKSSLNSSIAKSIKRKDEIKKSDNERKENSSPQQSSEVPAQTENVEEQSNEQHTKSKMLNPKETNSEEKINSPQGQGKDKQPIKNTLNSSKYETKNQINNNKESLQQNNKDKEQKNPTESKTSLRGAKQTIDNNQSSESKTEPIASVSGKPSPSSKTKTQRLKTEKEEENLVKVDKKTNSEKKSKLLHPKSKISSVESRNGKSKTKKAQKLLVSFFHNEVDDDEHAEGALEKKTHVVKDNEHGQQNTQDNLSNNDTQHPEKKTQVAKLNEHDEQSTQDDLQSSHTHDQESTLAEISDKLYRRTGLQPQPLVTNPNNNVMETVLLSGPNADAPQHIRLSNEPTHVIFKPVHKYYPAIHRYMTKPIHRYLKKPILLSGVNPPLQGQEFREASSPQVKEYTAPPVVQHNVGIPQVVANNLAPVSGGLRVKGLQLEVKQYNAPPTRVHQVGIGQVQPNVGQQVPGGLVNDQTPALQVKHYDGSTRPRIVPGGLVHDHHILPGGVGRAGPVRIFTQLPPRIQPVLIHPHRLSPTGFGPCSTNPCKNSAVCSTVDDQAMCVCRPGFRGKFCELVNRCHPNPCHNYGSCTEIERDFECSCKKGYRGKRCEIENKCEPSPCLNGATCSENEDDYVCTCREGFLGHSCEAESKCNPINPCKNGATCQEARDTYKCFCRDGFGGYNCEARIRRNICVPNPCQNGGFCTVTGASTGNYTCNCAAGWKGSTCVEKIDNWGNSVGPTICESVNPCMFGGKCTPVSYYDYTCICPQGRGGAHCEQDLRHPKFVSSCSHCHAYARCLDGQCSCKEGYVGDGKNCEAVQQFCHPNPCYNGGTCRQSTNQKRALYGGKPWLCECPSGYMGHNCQDMDLCLMRLCQNGGTCLSVEGKTKCLCPPAYRGKYCQEKDVCHGNPCKNGGLCKDAEGVATCSCPQEYEGAFCQHWKCSKCDRYASCVKGNCFCNEDYVGDGLTCRKKTPSPPKVVPQTLPPAPPPPSPSSPPPTPVHKYCDSNPCVSGASCLDALETYFCQCPENKYGKNCEQTPKAIVDLCAKCDIDAACKQGRCVCNEGFNGNGFTCRKSTPTVTHTSTVSIPHKTDSSCDFCPENGQCLDNVCVCPPGFQNRKRSCIAIDVPRVSNTALAKVMPPGIEYVGTTRNRLPIGQWKENSVVTEYQSMGCWADTKEWRNPIMRAIHSMEGLHPSLNDDYKKRSNPITKCAQAAKAYRYKVFAVQNGGQCFADSHAGKTYTTYGPSTQCRFGVGGALANDVYTLPK